MQQEVGNEFLMGRAAEERVRDNVLTCYLKVLNYGKLLVAAFVAVFFVSRLLAINAPGYSQCSPMLAYGQWEGPRWTSVVCIPGQYESKDEVLDCLSRDVAVVLIGGELQRDVFNHMVTLLGGEGTSDEENAVFVDNSRHLNVSFYWHLSHDRPPLELYQRLLEDKDQLQKTTAVFHAGCPKVDGPGGMGEEESSGVEELLKKQRALLKRSPKVTVAWIPQEDKEVEGAFATCSEESQAAIAASGTMYLSPLATLKDRPKDGLPPQTETAVMNLMLNTFCNALLPSNTTCCVAHHRTTFLNILIAVLLLVAAVYAGIQLILITNTMKGILPLCGVQLDKDEDGIGKHIHHPMFSLPLKLGVVAIVMGYVIAVKSTPLLMDGERTMDYLDMVLPCIALGMVLFGSIGFARDRETLWSMEIAHEMRGVAVVGIILLEVMDPTQIAPYTRLRALGALFMFVFGYEQFMEQVAVGGATSKGISQALLRFGVLSFVVWMGGASPILSVGVVSWLAFWSVYAAVASSLYLSAVKQQSRGLSLMSSVCVPRKVVTIVMTVVVAVVTSLVITSNVLDQSTPLLWEVGMLRGDTVSVACGVVVGVLLCSLQEARSEGLPEVKNAKTPTLVLMSLVGGTLAIFAYLLVACLQRSAEDYSAVHPFVAPLLLAGYLLVRVASPFQRAVQCHGLQLCGRVGVELFLLYHCVLLSGPHKAVLYLLPNHLTIGCIVLVLAMILLATALQGVFKTQLKEAPKTPHGQRNKV